MRNNSIYRISFYPPYIIAVCAILEPIIPAAPTIVSFSSVSVFIRNLVFKCLFFFSTQRYEIENSCPNHKNESPINKSYE